MRLAEARLSASIIKSSSMILWSVGLQVGWTTKTSAPRTLSSIRMRVSPFLNFPTSARPRGLPRASVISGARAGVAAVAQRDRRAQDRVAAHEHVVADHGAVLAQPIVIGGDRTGAQVDARADRRIADVADMVARRAGPDGGVLDLGVVADL